MESLSNGTSPVLLLIANVLSSTIAVMMWRWRVEKNGQQDARCCLSPSAKCSFGVYAEEQAWDYQFIFKNSPKIQFGEWGSNWIFFSFHSKIILDLQKNCKDGIRNSHIIFTQFLLLTFNIPMLHLSKQRK